MANAVNINPIFEPLLIRTDKPDDVFKIYRRKISKKTVEAILHCIKYNKSELTFLEIIIPSSKHVITIHVEEDNFLENLEKNLETLIEYEEYELCAEIVKAKEAIANGLPKKPKRRSKKKQSDDIDNLINTIKNL
jgi:hypothetical protein